MTITFYTVDHHWTFQTCFSKTGFIFAIRYKSWAPQREVLWITIPAGIFSKIFGSADLFRKCQSQ